jgi:hypothetical protein
MSDYNTYIEGFICCGFTAEEAHQMWLEDCQEALEATVAKEEQKATDLEELVTQRIAELELEQETEVDAKRQQLIRQQLEDLYNNK